MPERERSSGTGAGADKLAERLRRSREAKGVTPETASEESAVPVRYVRMFEEGRYPVVSDPAYLAHFVRRYAMYLGLDAEQASRDLIAETEPETALRRAGKLSADPKVEPSMTQKESGSQGRDTKPAKPKAAAKAPARRFKFDAGPISLVGAAVTLGLFLLTLWEGKTPKKTAATASEEVVHSEVAAASTAAPAAAEPTAPPAAAPAPPVAAEPPAAPPPAAAPAASAPAAEPPAPPPAPPPPAAVEPPPPPAPPPAAAKPAAPPAPAAKPAAPPPPAAAAAPAPAHAPSTSGGGAPSAAKSKERVSATNRASDALRAEQLERLKSKEQGGAPAAAPAAAAPAASPAAPEAAPPAQ